MYLTSNWFRKLLKSILGEKHNPQNDWVNVKGKLPKWVYLEINKIQKRNSGGSESYLNRYWVIKGNRYIYRIQFGGQHGYTHIIQRKRR